MLRLAPEGTPFIAVFFILTVIAIFAFGPRIAVIPLILTLFMVYFFRDPERITPIEPGFISPADGKIIVIKKVREDEYIHGEALKISVFMSPMNVHVNRAPADGKILAIKHTPGSFKAAWEEEASMKNENIAMLLECAEGNVLVRQIAGFVARRAVNRMTPGDTLKRGERFGIIKFSSRVDIFLPPGAVAKVKLDDMVKAGETVLAVMGPK